MLDILIPTYKRKVDLLNNLYLLKKQITNDKLEHIVKIIVSDNCSNDGTEETIHNFIISFPEIKLEYYKQNENIGLEKNAVFILSKSVSEYVMFLGDDDMLPEGYINFCVDEIKHDNLLGCIIPGNIDFDPITKKINTRKTNYEIKRFNPGFNA